MHGVILNHFNKSLHLTLSELDETWYVSSACGFRMSDKIWLRLDVTLIPIKSKNKQNFFQNFMQ